MNTLEELIDALDGPLGASTELPVTPQAICNWKARGFIPPSRHLQTVILLKRKRKRVNPEIFDCTEDDWRLLGFLPRCKSAGK